MDNQTKPKNCFTIKQVMDGVHLVKFDTQMNMAATFIRFQEHYESPKFKNQIFEFEDYVEYYCKKHDGIFDYYEKIIGFNFESTSIQAFVEASIKGQTVLRPREREFIQAFGVDNPYYIPHYFIGVFKTTNKCDDAINHELAHAMFWMQTRDYRNYKMNVIEVMNKYKEINHLLYPTLHDAEYHNDLLIDECHAWLMESESAWRTGFEDCRVPRGGWHHFYLKTAKERKELKKIFNEYKKEYYQ